jgi:hypothetical protein
MIGTDNRLKSQLPTALPQPKKSPQTNYPGMISQGRVDAVSNNMLAGAAGAGAAYQQKMAGRGMSRGRAAEARGQRAQDEATAQAQLGSAQNQMQAADANARTRFAYDSLRESERLGNQGLLNNLMDARGRSALARQGMGLDTMQTHMQGRLGLDSMYLDTSPILKYLLEN